MAATNRRNQAHVGRSRVARRRARLQAAAPPRSRRCPTSATRPFGSTPTPALPMPSPLRTSRLPPHLPLQRQPLRPGLAREKADHRAGVKAHRWVAELLHGRPRGQRSSTAPPMIGWSGCLENPEPATRELRQAPRPPARWSGLLRRRAAGMITTAAEAGPRLRLPQGREPHLPSTRAHRRRAAGGVRGGVRHRRVAEPRSHQDRAV